MNLQNWSMAALKERQNRLEEAMLDLDTEEGPAFERLCAEYDEVEAEYQRRFPGPTEEEIAALLAETEAPEQAERLRRQAEQEQGQGRANERT